MRGIVRILKIWLKDAAIPSRIKDKIKGNSRPD
jgi:hypothetical protein